jgi:hypothetical protein
MAKKTLLQAKTEMLAARESPGRYRIDCDVRTDNLLVCGPTLAFAVTRLAIDKGYHVSFYSPSLDALILAETNGATKVDLPPIERMPDVE